MDLSGKHIILGVTGSIAAYKAATLCRLLVRRGAQVKVVVTPLAREFITPVTLATLSQNTVLCDFFRHDDGAWNSHVALGVWADLMLVAPATANTLAKMATGVADNLLLTTYLSARCPVMLAPAMDMDMYRHPATQANLATLAARGNILVAPDEGELASGLIGKGRMAEPEAIADQVAQFLLSRDAAAKSPLAGETILVTAGPTYEPIDPVRFVGNYSTGKMGIALARELVRRGAKVKLVLGPVAQQPLQEPGIEVIPVTTADQMHAAALELFPACQGAVMAAAVADYTPRNPATTKIKRKGPDLTLELRPTADIAARLGQSKRADQFLVGFALETDDEMANAHKKMTAKNLDMIVLNSLRDSGAGFGHDTNKITLLYKSGETSAYPLKTKDEVAADIVNEIEKLTNNVV